MVMAPARIRIAEKYVNQRTGSFTRTHARAMEEWKGAHSGSEDGYWEDFRRQVARAEERYQRNLRGIEDDQNTSYAEKRVLKNRLRSLYPAWTAEQEQKFIEVYGDPRTIDRGSLLGLLEGLRGQVWEDALRGGEQRRVEKQPWEMKFYDALVNPQDGSVPLAIDAPAISPSVEGARDSAPHSQPTPSAAGLSEDPEIERMAQEFVKNICPVCKVPQKKLNAMHVRACERKHSA